MVFQKHEKYKTNFKFYEIASISFFIFGVVVRVYWAINHFTHWDDMGLITTLMHLRSQGELLSGYHQYSWTYAPLQVFLTGITIQPEFSYNVNVFLGRLPSCVSGIISIGALYCLIGFMFNESKHCKKLQLIATAIISLSWVNIIYSAQAEPYEIGVLGVIAITFYLVRISRTKTLSVLVTIGLTLFVLYSQYHGAIILLSMYMSVFFLLNKDNKIKLVIASVASFALSTPLIISFFKGGLLGKSLNWNVGINGQFLFPSTSSNEIFSFNTVAWFCNNMYLFIKNFYISNQDNLVIFILTLIFMLLCFAGFVQFHCRKKTRIIAIYLDLIGVIFLVLIIGQKFCFSPSRHLLLLHPIFIVLFCNGVLLLLDLFKSKTIVYSGILLWAALMLWVNIDSTIKEVPLRQNLVLSGELEKVINEYKPGILVFYYGFDSYLMDLQDYEVMGERNPFGMNSYKRTGEYSGLDTTVFVGIGRKIDTEIYKGILGHLNYVGADGFYVEGLMQEDIFSIFENSTESEVEYARNAFWNNPNGLYVYGVK